LDFIKKRVKQYQEKKLNEALSKMKFHIDMKNELENKVEINDDSEKIKIRKEISYHAKMVDIWKNNSEKIKKEMKKIDD
jgi:hypothetical protein